MRRVASVALGATIIGLSLPVVLAAAPASAVTSGYRAFSDTGYWNTSLPADAPRHPDSKQIIDFLRQDNSTDYVYLSGTGSSGKWGQPVYWAEPGDPEYDVTSTRYFVPPEFKSLRIPRDAKPDPTSDSEMTIYDLDRGYVAGLWNAEYDSETDTWTAGGGDIFYLDSNGLHKALPGSDEPRNTGAHRGLPPPSYAIRLDEVQAGRIDHLIKIGVHTTKDEHVFPMIGDENGTSYQFAPPEGTRIRIKPSVNLSTFGLSPAAKVVARALQEYGAIIGDQTGGPVELKMENTVAEGRGQLWNGVLDHYSLSAIPLSAYEVIDHGYKPPAGQDTGGTDEGTDTGGTDDGTDTGGTDDGADTGDGTDDDSGTVTPRRLRVRVTSPRTRVVRAGSRIDLTWKTSADEGDFARIRYRKNGRGFRTIRFKTADDGHLSWRVPRPLDGARLRFKVIVRASDVGRGVAVSRWYHAG